MSIYPEHEKLRALRPPSDRDLLTSEFAKNQVVGDFLEWLAERGVVLCKATGHFVCGSPYAPITESHERLIALHFDIDENALEREKRALLAEIRRK